jgi:hypothetical protein
VKTKLWRAFWDYEKEEKWLNKMAAKGFAMTDYSIFHYTFEDCIPGEWVYRIELLEYGAKHAESVRYIHFLEENGIQHIATYRSWIYLRKKAISGTFKLYNDLDSRMKHYQRIANLWFVLGLCEFLLTTSQIGGFVSSLESGTWIWIASLVCGALALSVAVLFFGLWRKYRKKIKHLQREREIHE